jgi:8-oxo-dGTP diphosphatase
MHREAARIPCVGAIVPDGGGRLLLVKRGHPPEAGRWSIPGGRIEPGESDQQALVREVREETGLDVAPGELAGSVERAQPDGSVLEIRDYTATVTGGRLAAGDDAADTVWAGPADLAGLPLTRGLLTALTAWGVLGAAPPPAVIADATRRAGLLWLSVPGQDRPYPAWHIWSSGAAYLVTGPGEQPLPGLADGGLVAVTAVAKDPGGHLVTWQARVHRVAPGSPEWDSVAGPLEAGRLNPPSGVSGPGAAGGAVYRLAPAA